MSAVGRRVELVEWAYEGILKLGTRGTILKEYPRGFEVKWDVLTYPKGMRPEEVDSV